MSAARLTPHSPETRARAIDVIRSHGGDCTKASAELGIPRRTLGGWWKAVKAEEEKAARQEARARKAARQPPASPAGEDDEPTDPISLVMTKLIDQIEKLIAEEDDLSALASALRAITAAKKEAPKRSRKRTDGKFQNASLAQLHAAMLARGPADPGQDAGDPLVRPLRGPDIPEVPVGLASPPPL